MNESLDSREVACIAKWVEHEGKQIFLADYSNLGTDLKALQNRVDFVNETLTKKPANSVLLLVDTRDTAGTSEITGCLQESAKVVKLHIRKTAVVGVSGYRRILMRGVARISGLALEAIDSIDEAKEWLVQ